VAALSEMDVASAGVYFRNLLSCARQPIAGVSLIRECHLDMLFDKPLW